VTPVRIAVPLAFAVVSALAALAIVPRAFEAQVLLAAQDDPAALADYAVARSFDATIAGREIDAALAAGDADLALSFLDLAREHNVPIDPTLVEKVERANAKLAVAARSFGSFARGLVTGEADDVSGFAGTALGDLFVLGDIRDAVRQGARLATGGEADEAVLAVGAFDLSMWLFWALVTLLGFVASLKRMTEAIIERSCMRRRLRRARRARAQSISQHCILAH
jgi:hypothetical protein